MEIALYSILCLLFALCGFVGYRAGKRGGRLQVIELIDQIRTRGCPSPDRFSVDWQEYIDGLKSFIQ